MVCCSAPMTWQSNWHLMHYKVCVHVNIHCNPGHTYSTVHTCTIIRASLTLFVQDYIVAEFGDFDEQKHTDEFLSDYIFLPPVGSLLTHTHTLFLSSSCDSFLCTCLQHIGPPSVLKSLIERVSQHCSV